MIVKGIRQKKKPSLTRLLQGLENAYRRCSAPSPECAPVLRILGWRVGLRLAPKPGSPASAVFLGCAMGWGGANENSPAWSEAECRVRKEDHRVPKGTAEKCLARQCRETSRTTEFILGFLGWFAACSFRRRTVAAHAVERKENHC